MDFLNCSISTALNVRIDVKTMKAAEHNTQNRTPVLATDSEGSSDRRHEEASTVPVSSGHAQPLSSGAEILQTPCVIPTGEELFRLIVSNYLSSEDYTTKVHGRT